MLKYTLTQIQQCFQNFAVPSRSVDIRPQGQKPEVFTIFRKVGPRGCCFTKRPQVENLVSGSFNLVFVCAGDLLKFFLMPVQKAPNPFSSCQLNHPQMNSSPINDRFQSKYPQFNFSLNFYSLHNFQFLILMTKISLYITFLNKTILF